ncbi:MAG: tetratricopeptide repeat protein [Verrucomicrobia bacterium]|nr:tetratricopeptide repeat protein [Verrucomicrobiota bacterium]
MNRYLAFPLFVIIAWLAPCAAADAPSSAPLDDARAALKANDLPKAAALLAPLTLPESKDAAAFSLFSEVKLAQKDTKGAVAMAEKATALDATKPAYFSQLGLALGQRMGEITFMEQAMMAGKLRKAFAKAVELDPNDLSGLIGLARYYATAPAIAGGSPEKAKEYATRVQRLDAALGEAELGNLAERADDFATALGHYETLVKLKPASAGPLAACGRVLAKLGRKDEARVKFEAALKLNPESEAAKKGLAALGAPKP